MTTSTPNHPIYGQTPEFTSEDSNSGYKRAPIRQVYFGGGKFGPCDTLGDISINPHKNSVIVELGVDSRKFQATFRLSSDDLYVMLKAALAEEAKAAAKARGV